MSDATSPPTKYLPDELLGDILSRLDRQDIFSAASASRRFHRLAAEQPTHTFNCSLRVEPFLFRSPITTFIVRLQELCARNLQIELTITEECPLAAWKGRSLWRQTGRALSAALSDSRVVSLSVFSQAWSSDVSGLLAQLQCRAPWLRKLVLNSGPRHDMHQPAVPKTLFSGGAPRLREVNICDVPLSSGAVQGFAHVNTVVLRRVGSHALARCGTIFPLAESLTFGLYSDDLSHDDLKDLSVFGCALTNMINLNLDIHDLLTRNSPLLHLPSVLRRIGPQPRSLSITFTSAMYGPLERIYDFSAGLLSLFDTAGHAKVGISKVKGYSGHTTIVYVVQFVRTQRRCTLTIHGPEDRAQPFSILDPLLSRILEVSIAVDHVAELMPAVLQMATLEHVEIRYSNKFDPLSQPRDVGDLPAANVDDLLLGSTASLVCPNAPGSSQPHRTLRLINDSLETLRLPRTYAQSLMNELNSSSSIGRLFELNLTRISLVD